MSHRPKVIILIILILLFLFLIPLPSASDNKNETSDDIIITNIDSSLSKYLIVGGTEDTIINPKSISFKILLENNSDYQESLKAKKDSLFAKADIYLIKAENYINNLVKEYADKNNIKFVIEENAFFKSIRKIARFKNKSIKELKAIFDITDDIINYEKEIKEIETEKNKKILKDLFSD